MLRRDYTNQNCSIASTLERIGERWTILILRELFMGVHRFDEIQRDLGVARNVLTDRLNKLVEHGILARQQYEERPPRYEYRLTEKGRDFFPVLAAMIAWGDRWEAGEDGPPVLLRHERCGQFAHAVAVCSACGEKIDPSEVTPVPGPGASASAARGDMPAALARLVEAQAAEAGNPA